MRRSLQSIVLVVALGALGYAAWVLAKADLLGPLETARLGSAAGFAPAIATRRLSKPSERPVAPPSGSPATGTEANVALAIEVARIDADGVSVLAGRAPAGRHVSILANGREVASAIASDQGQWSAVISGQFVAGPLELSLTARSLDKAAGGKPGEQARETRSASVWLVVPKGEGRTAQAVDGRPRREASGTIRQAAAVTAVPTTTPVPAAREMARFEALVDRARDGGTSDAIAAVSRSPIPVPITFHTGAATMTGHGIDAAALLAEYLRLLSPKGIVLSGHADSRGPDGYNMELSRRRLEAIEQYLRGQGYKGQLALLPKGEQEPYQAVDRARLGRQEAWQADRRVELRLTQ